MVECEWESKRRDDKKISHSGIKYDFQKLLVANADLRLMIFLKRKHDKIRDFDNYFDSAIESYLNLKEGKFLFIAYDKELLGFHYAEKFKVKREVSG